MAATHSNTSTTSTPVLRKHLVYFFPEADVTFRVENHLFKVHKRFFFRESSYFSSFEEFAALLWVFYNPKYSIYTATVEKWTQILTLAQRWSFPEVERLCVRELDKLQIPAVEKIQLYQDFKLDKSTLGVSFAELTIRPGLVSLEEGYKLGMETALQIMRARESYRGLYSRPRPSAAQLKDSVLPSLIREIFSVTWTTPILKPW
ncbi:hypothetical protein BC826DRAFT_1105392 [Russula brevipes]|nr:hypothetical protein BC826DRAFT_1105392 [Russula brevipes]